MTISNERKLELANALKSYFEDKKDDAANKGGKFSQNDLATKTDIGLTSSQIGYIFRGQFDAKNNHGTLMLSDRTWAKVEQFLGLKNELWETTNYELCYEAFMECKINSKHRIIDGETGSGKSYAAEMFVKQYPLNTFLITCATDQNPKQFFIEMGLAIGLRKSELGGSRYDIRIKISERLLTMELALLIIDEAENAKPAVIGALKDIYDYKKLYRKVGFVIIGANDYYKTLVNNTTKRIQHAYPQFIRRFGTNHVTLAPYDKAEAMSICKQYSLTREERTEIVNKAQNLGMLNTLIQDKIFEQQLIEDE